MLNSPVPSASINYLTRIYLPVNVMTFTVLAKINLTKYSRNTDVHVTSVGKIFPSQNIYLFYKLRNCTCTVFSPH